MESWRTVWREGIAPSLNLSGLQALAEVLKNDDPRLLQGATTSPPPLNCIQDWPVDGACSIGICGWLGNNLTTVGEVEEYFAKICFECDQLIKEPVACRWYLNWFDDTPRGKMREELLVEVNLAISTQTHHSANGHANHSNQRS